MIIRRQHTELRVRPYKAFTGVAAVVAGQAFKLMHIFSYVFYTLSKMYRAGLDRQVPDIYASGLLSLFQMLNVITIFKSYLTEVLYVGVCVGILVINMIFFNSKTLKKFDERWDNEPKSQRLFRRTLVVLYAAVTVAAFLYVALR